MKVLTPFLLCISLSLLPTGIYGQQTKTVNVDYINKLIRSLESEPYTPLDMSAQRFLLFIPGSTLPYDQDSLRYRGRSPAIPLCIFGDDLVIQPRGCAPDIVLWRNTSHIRIPSEGIDDSMSRNLRTLRSWTDASLGILNSNVTASIDSTLNIRSWKYWNGYNWDGPNCDELVGLVDMIAVLLPKYKLHWPRISATIFYSPDVPPHDRLGFKPVDGRREDGVLINDIPRVDFNTPYAELDPSGIIACGNLEQGTYYYVP